MKFPNAVKVLTLSFRPLSVSDESGGGGGSPSSSSLPTNPSATQSSDTYPVASVSSIVAGTVPAVASRLRARKKVDYCESPPRKIKASAKASTKITGPSIANLKNDRSDDDSDDSNFSLNPTFTQTIHRSSNVTSFNIDISAFANINDDDDNSIDSTSSKSLFHTNESMIGLPQPKKAKDYSDNEMSSTDREQCSLLHGQILDKYDKLVINFAELAKEHSKMSPDDATKFSRAFVSMILRLRFSFKIERRVYWSSEETTFDYDSWNSMDFYLSKIQDLFDKEYNITSISEKIHSLFGDIWLLRLLFNKVVPAELRIDVVFNGFLKDVPPKEYEALSEYFLHSDYVYDGYNVHKSIKKNWNETKIKIALRNLGNTHHIIHLPILNFRNMIKLMMGTLGGSKSNTLYYSNVLSKQKEENELDEFINLFVVYMVSYEFV
jgi:hypothetical protein